MPSSCVEQRLSPGIHAWILLWISGVGLHAAVFGAGTECVPVNPGLLTASPGAVSFKVLGHSGSDWQVFPQALPEVTSPCCRSVGWDDHLHLRASPFLLGLCHPHGLEESCRGGENRAFLW